GIRALRAADILVSVETYLPAVARSAFEAGANILNLTGTDRAEEIFRMAAAHDAAVILCYVQGANVREVADFDFSADPIATMREHFARRIELALKNGVEKIFLDPGLLLLSQPAGQRRAGAASNDRFFEHVPAPHAGFS